MILNKLIFSTILLTVKPNRLENCRVVNQTETMIHVRCDGDRKLVHVPSHQFQHHLALFPSDPMYPSPQNPAEIGLFPEYYVMEVIDLNNLSIRRNLSAEIPVFILKGLAPGSWLKLNLYAANSHGKSEPVTIDAFVSGDAAKHTYGMYHHCIQFIKRVAGCLL